MCEITIPSSPGWYLSNIIACNDDGSVVAYGAKHEVVIIRVNVKGSSCDVQPTFIPMAHKDRIVAVAFNPGNCELYPNHLVSCSDDGTVHVWDYQTETLILSHSGHGDSQKVVSVDWSRADPNLVVSVSDQGSIVCWDLMSNTIRRLELKSKISPICMTCCPHNKDIVAIGAKSGLILIHDVKGVGNTVFRLRGHETDVVSLSWCPVARNIYRSGDEATCLLASGAKDRSIYLWRAGSDGRYDTFINLPQQAIATAGYRSKNNLGGAGNNWICVRWMEEYTLVVSSLYGELLSYDLKKSEQDGKLKIKPPRLLHGQHSKGLFSIAAPLHPTNPQNRVIWSYALDKHLVGCKFDDGKVVSDITTIGGIVYCLASSPLDPNRIAIGTGDNKMLVWNMSNDTCNNISSYWNKINSKVMAVAWHPVNESILAFGTGEGRVGVIDISKGSNSPKIFRQYHRRCVYSLIWSPPIVEISDRKTNFALFSVGDGDILQHNPDTPDKEPINLSSYFKQCDASVMVSKPLGRTDLAWNHDRSLAAVGNENGVLFIVDGHTFNHVHTIFAHKKLVQCTVWHPASVTSEDALSPFHTWLASASDNIQIINVTSAGVDVVASLNTHSEKVVSLAWSPHFNGRLISASYDYTSQVWDVAASTVLACFDGHHGAVVCCLPSALHQDWIITGSADNTVRVWNMNNFRLTKTKTKKQRLTGAMKKFACAREAAEITPKIVEKYEYEPKPINGEATTVKHVEFAANVDYKRKPKSMFPVTSTGMTQAKHISLLWGHISGTEATKKVSVGNSGYLDFFGDNQSMRRLAVVEEMHHREHGNATQADNFSMWSGDIAESIKDACRKKQLNDWLVSLAPMVSHKLWTDCCKNYALQLSETGDTLKAVSYYLSVHMVEEAIDLLLQAKLYREAVCLAKLRLPRDDCTVKKAMTEWASHCLSTGMVSLAAHCMLSIGANIEAVEILSRSKDSELLALASDIAIKADANEMGLSLAMRAINTALENQNYAIARETSNHHPALEDLAVWIDVCELKNSWVAKEDKLILAWVRGSVNEGEKWPGLYEKAFDLCKKKLSSYTALLKFLPNRPAPDSEQKVWVYIAGQISLAAAAQLQANNTRCVLKHLILAMEAGYNYHLHNPSNAQFYLQLCVWISPWGPLGTLPQIQYSEITLIESFCSFLGCGVVYWLDILNTKDLLPVTDEETMNDLHSTISRCAALLFHKDIMSYHKADVEIKKLESAIASSKLKALKAMKYCKDIEAQLQVSGETPGPETAEDTTAESEADSKKLIRLKQQKTAFEEEHIYSPNPFITFCTLRNVLESICGKHPATQATLDDLKSVWERENGQN
uniref:Gem-associated protein 5 n=2 Tax=Lygus hesperus TaxID=30085 RepID=A0A146LNJ2_LYGHE